MNTTYVPEPIDDDACSDARSCGASTDAFRALIDASEFRTLMVSHRRMVRADRAEDRLKGLRDLDTGELFFVSERHLLES